jgi:hypothetical protein
MNIILILIILGLVNSFKLSLFVNRVWKLKQPTKCDVFLSQNNLRSQNPVRASVGSKNTNIDRSISEIIHRKYPYENLSLPMLTDRNNYYSGDFDDMFWHQNGDQVYIYVPLENAISRDEIDLTFEVKRLRLVIKDQEVFSIQLPERITPDSSFWVLETDSAGKKYIQIDMEKRFRMINWKNLFGSSRSTGSGTVGSVYEAEGGGGAVGEESEGTSAWDDDPVESQRRADILEKFLAANKGVSKLSGVPAETLSDMMASGDLAKMFAEEVFPSAPPVSFGFGARSVDVDADVEVEAGVDGEEPTTAATGAVNSSNGNSIYSKEQQQHEEEEEEEHGPPRLQSMQVIDAEFTENN